MARLLGYFIKKEGLKQVNVLVATSGDTGSAVANGFLGVPGIHVYVLYPGKGQPVQECQFNDIRTEHHGIGDRRHVRRLPSAG